MPELGRGKKGQIPWKPKVLILDLGALIFDQANPTNANFQTPESSVALKAVGYRAIDVARPNQPLFSKTKAVLVSLRPLTETSSKQLLLRVSFKSFWMSVSGSAQFDGGYTKLFRKREGNIFRLTVERFDVRMTLRLQPRNHALY